MRSGRWGDSEGFLEAVTLSRALKRRFLHSLNEYRRLLCTSPSGPCDIVLPIYAKIAKAPLSKGVPTQQRDANHIGIQGLDKDPCGLRLLTPVSARAGARVPMSHHRPLLHTVGARLVTARPAAPVGERAGADYISQHAPRGPGARRGWVSQSRTVNICISRSRLANGGRVNRRRARRQEAGAGSAGAPCP